MPLLRPATKADLPAVEAIDTPDVLGSDCTLQREPTSPSQRRAWFAELQAEGLPVLVAEEAGGVPGFGALVRFNTRGDDLLATITAREQQSLRLHRSRGFVEVGRLTEVGFKLGAWVDVVLLQRRLT